jgi:hypothetical protein
VNITNNLTTIVVNNITYVIPQNVVILLGKQLRIGVPIVFVGQVDAGGQIIIVNVTHINNRVWPWQPPTGDARHRPPRRADKPAMVERDGESINEFIEEERLGWF